MKDEAETVIDQTTDELWADREKKLLETRPKCNFDGFDN